MPELFFGIIRIPAKYNPEGLIFLSRIADSPFLTDEEKAVLENCARYGSVGEEGRFEFV